MRNKLARATVLAMLLLAVAWSGPAAAQQKSAKDCNAEWKAGKAQIQASGKTRKAFIAECRGTASAAPAGTAAVPPPATAAPPAAAPGQPANPLGAPPARRAARTAPAGAPAALGQGQYASEAEAKGRCFGDTVVWANLNTKVYHYAGARQYGTTRKGAYMCERDTAAAGLRAAKREKRPGQG